MTALDQLAAVALESELQLQQEEAQARDAQAQAQAQADEPASWGPRGAAEDVEVAGAAAGLEPAVGSSAGQVKYWETQFRQRALMLLASMMGNGGLRAGLLPALEAGTC